jgi:hypothetical protein
VFNFVKVSFPETSITPKAVYSAEVYQNRYEHEIAVVRFRDWGVEYDVVSPGSLVALHIYNLKHEERNFHGYIHHIKAVKTPGTDLTEMVIVGGSFPMKQPSQTVYRDMSADMVIKQIALNHGFACYAEPHPRIYPQISQAGHTDWELMVKLAKQSGYTLRTQNTELYFQPIMKDYTDLRSEAHKFTMRNANSPDGSNLYSFSLMVGESLPFEDAMKSAVAITGVDAGSASITSITKQVRNKKTRTKSKPEFFDMFATDIVATDALVAKHEAEAAENRNSFPYRATAEVIGTPSLRPDMPVYLEGLGPDYSGYWIILGVEHRIIEDERNAQKFTTVLYLGIDSLGSHAVWTDGTLISSPDYRPSRTVIPNVRQVNIVPKTKMVQTYNKIGPQSSAAFSAVKNRAVPKINNRASAASKWKTVTPLISNVTQHNDTTPSTVKARYKKALGLK